MGGLVRRVPIKATLHSAPTIPRFPKAETSENGSVPPRTYMQGATCSIKDSLQTRLLIVDPHHKECTDINVTTCSLRDALRWRLPKVSPHRKECTYIHGTTCSTRDSLRSRLLKMDPHHKERTFIHGTTCSLKGALWSQLNYKKIKILLYESPGR